MVLNSAFIQVTHFLLYKTCVLGFVDKELDNIIMFKKFTIKRTSKDTPKYC